MAWTFGCPEFDCTLQISERQVSEEAAPSQVSNDEQEEEQAASKCDSVDLHKIPHCLCDRGRQDEVLSQDACSPEATQDKVTSKILAGHLSVC